MTLVSVPSTPVRRPNAWHLAAPSELRVEPGGRKDGKERNDRSYPNILADAASNGALLPMVPYRGMTERSRQSHRSF